MNDRRMRYENRFLRLAGFAGAHVYVPVSGWGGPFDTRKLKGE